MSNILLFQYLTFVARVQIEEFQFLRLLHFRENLKIFGDIWTELFSRISQKDILANFGDVSI